MRKKKNEYEEIKNSEKKSENHQRCKQTKDLNITKYRGIIKETNLENMKKNEDNKGEEY